MQARLKKQNEITIVALSGRVDVETAEPFRAVCLKEFRGLQLVFDFAGLNFVGSQGILPFLETFQVLQETNPGSFRFSGMGIDFRRVFEATPLSTIGAFETIDGAIASFYAPKLAAVPLVTDAAAKAADFLAYRAAPADEPKKTFDSFESDDDLEV